jgi:hypothetical protein
VKRFTEHQFSLGNLLSYQCNNFCHNDQIIKLIFTSSFPLRLL